MFINSDDFQAQVLKVLVDVQTCGIVDALSDGALAVVVWKNYVDLCIKWFLISCLSQIDHRNHVGFGLKAMMSVIVLVVECWMLIEGLHLRAG